MCKLKSAIILKDRVFVPDYDSHSKMLEELGIADTKENAERLFVRAELSPKNGGVFSPIDEWEYTVDQDIVPDWYVERFDKERMIDAVKAWANTHIFVGEHDLIIENGDGYYIKDCKDVCIGGSATVEYIGGSATVEYIGGSATAKRIEGSATVKRIGGSATAKRIEGSATVKRIGGSATVKRIEGSATVEYIGGSAIVTASIYGWNCEQTTIECNAILRDLKSKTIYHADGWIAKTTPTKIDKP